MKKLNIITIVIFTILSLSTFTQGISIGLDIDPTPEALALVVRVGLILSVVIILFQFIGSIFIIVLKRCGFLSKPALIVFILSIIITSFKGLESIVLNSVVFIVFLLVRGVKVERV